MSVAIPIPLNLVRDSLVRGDKAAIARKLDCSLQMVMMVMSGKRGVRETKLTYDIKALAEKLGKLNNQKKILLEPQNTEA